MTKLSGTLSVLETVAQTAIVIPITIFSVLIAIILVYYDAVRCCLSLPLDPSTSGLPSHWLLAPPRSFDLWLALSLAARCPSIPRPRACPLTGCSLPLS
jgi:hypothetical protein